MKDETTQREHNLLERVDKLEAIDAEQANHLDDLYERVRNLERIVGCERTEAAAR